MYITDEQSNCVLRPLKRLAKRGLKVQGFASRVTVHVKKALKQYALNAAIM